MASRGDKGIYKQGALRLLGFCTLVWGPDSPGDVTQVKRVGSGERKDGGTEIHMATASAELYK